jgi:quinol monooxygenase YgiN
MIIVSGTLRLAAEHVDQAMALGATMAEASLAEEGCSAYGFWQSSADPTLVRVFEEWASEEDLGTHFATPHMADFMAGLGQLSISEMELSKYTVSDKSPLM